MTNHAYRKVTVAPPSPRCGTDGYVMRLLQFLLVKRLRMGPVASPRAAFRAAWERKALVRWAADVGQRLFPMEMLHSSAAHGARLRKQKDDIE